MYQTLWATRNTVLREKFIDMNTYIKTERSQLSKYPNDASHILRKTGKRQLKTIGMKRIIKTRAKM